MEIQDAERAEAVSRMLRSATPGKPIEPLSDAILPNSEELGYRIQEINVRHRLREGRTVVGRKVGLTSPEIQARIGTSSPDYGTLLDDMAIEPGQSISLSTLHAPRAEGEIAFCVGPAIAKSPSNAEELLRSIDWMAPAIEIVDSRIRGWKVRLADTVADNASSALFVVGNDRRAPDPQAIAATTMELWQNGKVVSSGHAQACLGNPLNSLAWLVQALSGTEWPLASGDIVLTGALGPQVPLTAGNRYELRLSGFAGLGVDVVA